MSPRELVRRTLFAGLGLAQGACGGDGLASAGGDIVNLTTPSASAAEPIGTSPSASVKRRPQKAPGSGYVAEENGLVHRAGPTACDTTIDQPACKGTEQHKDCTTDADCGAAPHGKCTSWFGQVGDGCSCSYACASDDDCASQTGTVCVCKDFTQEGQSTCVPAKCPADDACTSGLCALSRYDNGCGVTLTLACKTLNDDCQTTADCGPRQSCGVNDKDVWTCMSAGCVIGRPLTVDGRWAQADPRARDDWSGGERRTGRVDGSTARPSSAGEEAAFWLEMAALEHASVASFARVSLQLLALGAPAELVRDTQRAALDEIDHAQLAYGFASSALGRRVGPGALSEAAIAFTLDVGAIVHSLVTEGCVGETLGAIEALEHAARTSDTEIARALQRVGEDELRHAELAFRALRWLVESRGEVAPEAARSALRSLEATSAPAGRRAASIRGIVRPLVDVLTT